jgi:hypothetical protein
MNEYFACVLVFLISPVIGVMYNFEHIFLYVLILDRCRPRSTSTLGHNCHEAAHVHHNKVLPFVWGKFELEISSACGCPREANMRVEWVGKHMAD